MMMTASVDGKSATTEKHTAASSLVLDRMIDTPCAWRSGDAQMADGRVTLGQAALDELGRVARRIADTDGAIEDLAPESYEMPEAAKVMRRVCDQVYDGIGFAILDRLPVGDWDERTSKTIVWLMTSHLGAIVEQKLNGTRLYDVRDTGAAVAHGVRRSITNLEQEFHTDGAWLTETPQAIALACLRQAGAGGLSRVASLASVHNDMRARHRDLLPALYRPFWWDRQAEHPAEESSCSRHPVFAKNGQRLIVRYYDDYIRSGHKLMHEPLDAEAADALYAMREIIESPGYALDFRLEAGQIEFANNHLVAHARTAFEDAERGAGRHLLRLWMRRTGSIDLESNRHASTSA